MPAVSLLLAHAAAGIGFTWVLTSGQPLHPNKISAVGPEVRLHVLSLSISSFGTVPSWMWRRVREGKVLRVYQEIQCGMVVCSLSFSFLGPHLWDSTVILLSMSLTDEFPKIRKIRQLFSFISFMVFFF